MHVHHVGFRIKGFYRLAQFGPRWEMTPNEAQHRLTILQFFARYGQAATCEAFGVSRRTLSRWQQTFTQADGDPRAWAARSSAPCRRRQSMWPPALSQEIRRLRTTYPNLGKAKLHGLLRPWCAQQNLALPSVSTLGRLIARAPDKMRHAPSRLDARGRPKPVARPRKARPPKGIRHGPLQVFACETVVRLQAGLRRDLFTFIDPHTRFAVAFAAATPSSRQATRALDALCHLLPEPPRFVLSDNGSEFLGHFQQRLEERGITHWWTYPRSPKMNAHAERFNRTLQEQFVDDHEDLLFDDLADFNRKLADWLLFSNTERPHHSLRLHAPVQSLLMNHPECQRWWTHTSSCFAHPHPVPCQPRSSVFTVSCPVMARMVQPDLPQPDAQWWITLAQRLNIEDKVEQFFHDATTPHNVLDRVVEVDGDMQYILFVLVRHWIPIVLPPPGRERIAKHDPDYWLESAQILNAAVTRLRELKPLIDLLTTVNPLGPKPAPSASPIVEVELANMLQDIATVAGSYGGADYTSIIKNFDPIPLRQTQPFKHNKRHSAELWVVFLLREHFRTLNLGKDRYWPLLTDVITAAGIRQPNDHPFTAGELKSWWTKNWPRTYTLLKEKSDDGLPTVHTAYQGDYEWFQSWFMWELSQPAGPGR